jgi:hypothetical protein
MSVNATGSFGVDSDLKRRVLKIIYIMAMGKQETNGQPQVLDMSWAKPRFVRDCCIGRLNYLKVCNSHILFCELTGAINE